MRGVGDGEYGWEDVIGEKSGVVMEGEWMRAERREESLKSFMLMKDLVPFPASSSLCGKSLSRGEIPM